MATSKAAPKRDARSWDALTPPLAEWILDAVSTMGFRQMTPVQAATLPCFMGNKDVVVEVSSNLGALLPLPLLNLGRRLSPAAAKPWPT